MYRIPLSILNIKYLIPFVNATLQHGAVIKKNHEKLRK